MYSIVFNNTSNKQKAKISKFKIFVLCDHWVIYDPKFKFLIKRKIRFNHKFCYVISVNGLPLDIVVVGFKNRAILPEMVLFLEKTMKLAILRWLN